MAYTALGEAYEKRGKRTEARQGDYDFQLGWWNLVERLVAEGKVKAHPQVVGKGGLGGVLDG